LAIVLGVISTACKPPKPPEYEAPPPPSAVHIAYLQEDELWVAKTDGTESRKIAENLVSTECAPYYLSPDGRWVAYQTTDNKLWLATTDGLQQRKLVDQAVNSVSWFPDSQGLVYSWQDNIYVYWLTTSEPPQAVAVGCRNFMFPTWSPDGMYIVVLESQGTDIFNVVLVQSDGTGWRVLGTTSLPETPGPLCPGIIAWSPDSTRIIVDYGEPVFIFYVAGGTPIQANGGDGGHNYYWSPDGKVIAFRGSDDSLWLMDADGASSQKIVAEPVRDIAWSPGGNLIAYTEKGADGLGDLWVVDVGSGARQQLARDDPFIENSPAWTPDGTTLIFERKTADGEAAGIWRVGADASDLQRIVEAGKNAQVFVLR
jgi:Tol biopolymer transport system component